MLCFELIEQFLDHDSNPVFQTEVRIEGLPAGTGTGYSKKESQQNAAQMALKGDDIASIPLEEVAGKLKLVTEDHDLVIQGRRMGICFG